MKKRLMSDAFSRNLIAPVIPLNSLTSPITAQSHNPQPYAEENKEYKVADSGQVLQRGSAGFTNEKIESDYNERMKDLSRTKHISRFQRSRLSAGILKEKEEQIKDTGWVPYQGPKFKPGVLGFNRV